MKQGFARRAVWCGRCLVEVSSSRTQLWPQCYGHVSQEDPQDLMGNKKGGNGHWAQPWVRPFSSRPTKSTCAGVLTGVKMCGRVPVGRGVLCRGTGGMYLPPGYSVRSAWIWEASAGSSTSGSKRGKYAIFGTDSSARLVPDQTGLSPKVWRR